MNPNQKKCFFCDWESSPYCCPRCGQFYCTSKCYRHPKHLQCSEAFYKDCIIDSMKETGDTSESRIKMLEILKRVQENSELDSDDDEEEEVELSDLERKLSNMNLLNPDADINKIWNELSPQDKDEIEKALQTEQSLAELVTCWTPWWLKKQSKKHVYEIHESEQISLDPSVPPIPKQIISLSELTSVPPSQNVAYNLVNVLGAYCYTSRLYNGDHLEMNCDATEAILTLSTNLSSNQIFSSVEESLLSIKAQPATKLNINISDLEMAETMKNVCNILEGPHEDSQSVHYILAALSDLSLMLEKTKNDLNITSKRESRERKKLLTRCIKKIEYLISWTVPADKNSLKSMIANIQIEMAAILQGCEDQDRGKQRENKPVNNATKSTVLIEEIT